MSDSKSSSSSSLMTVIVLAVGFTAAAMFMKLVGTHFGNAKAKKTTMEDLLIIYYIWMVIFSSFVTVVIAYTLSLLVDVNVVFIIKVFLLAHLLGLPIFLYVFIRHSILFKQPLELPSDEELERDKKTRTIVCRDGKNGKGMVDAKNASYAMIIFSRILIVLSVIILMFMKEVQDTKSTLLPASVVTATYALT